MIAVSAVTSIFIIRFRLPFAYDPGSRNYGAGLLSAEPGIPRCVPSGPGAAKFGPAGVIVMLGGIGMGLANPASNNALLDLAPRR